MINLDVTIQPPSLDRFTETDAKLFPDLPTYLEGLQELKKEIKHIDSPKRIEELYYHHSKIMLQRLGTHTPELFNHMKFFRVRLNIPAGEDLSLIRTYSYPPGNCCQENGRANLKGKPVFYCCNDPYTAIRESKPEVGSVGHLSIWQGYTTRTMASVICLPFELNDGNPWRITAKESWDAYLDLVATESFDKSNHLKALGIFVAEQFMEESAPYPLTSWLSHKYLYESNPKDFIVYPSAEADHSSCNMAFHPNTVDQFITFKQVIRFTIRAINKDEIVISTGRTGEMDHTHIKWRTASDFESDFKNLL